MRTPDSPPVVARSQAKRKDLLLEGTLLSYTTIAHPPKGFGERARVIGLIELANGQRVLGSLSLHGSMKPEIGQIVVPRMKLSRVNEQGLRIYDVSYEVSERMSAPMEQEKVFPGYILALSGPPGVGKSTVSRLLTHMLCDFTATVPIVTNREIDASDREYRHFSLKDFEKFKRTGDLIAWTHAPSGEWYGYRASDIAAIWKEEKIPVVVTEMHLLRGLANHFGRRSLLSFGLLPPGQSSRAMLSQLLHRMRKRGSETEAQMRSHLTSAKADLEFFTKSKELFDHILVNEDLDKVLQIIKGHVLAATNN